MQISIVTACPPAADHARLFSGLASVELVGTATSGGDARRLVVDTLPDVAIVDVAIVEPGPEALLAFVFEHAPVTRVVLVFDDDGPDVYRALRCGAMAAVSSNLDNAAMAAAVHGVTRGEAHLPPIAAGLLIDEVDRASDQHGSHLAPSPSLTPTEREVLTQLSHGRSPGEIAAIHDVSARLVNLHVGYAVSKLHHYGIQRRHLDQHAG